MISMNFFQLALFGLAVFTSTSTCRKIGDQPSPNSRLAHGSLYSKWPKPAFDTAEDINDLHYNNLTKKSLYNLAGNNPSDESILGQAFLDLQALVTYVAGNPNAQVLARYFDPNDANDVNAIFNTVMQMASTSPPTNPPGARANLAPTDLHQISVTRASGELTTLAEAFNANALNTVGSKQEIKVYNFGWEVLWQRLLQSIKCSMIGPKTNYKMHFLGSLLLHETLHFNNIPILAWNQILQPDQALDDQPGSFPCVGKAYGPYEAIKLRGRSTAEARLNIENYVWYALETYWMHTCPASVPSGGMFIAPKNNDIPASCKQVAKSALANLWCWIS